MKTGFKKGDRVVDLKNRVGAVIGSSNREPVDATIGWLPVGGVLATSYMVEFDDGPIGWRAAPELELLRLVRDPS